MEFEVGQEIKLKKGHPCGGNHWKILRVGADFRLQCCKCNRIIMNPRKMVEKNFRGYIDNSSKSPVEKNDIIRKTSFVDVYLYYKFPNNCMNQRHDIQSVTLSVNDITHSKELQVNCFFCRNCQKYFINYEAVQEMVKSNIYPDFNYIIQKNDINLRPYSKLKLYGYSVQEGKMNSAERQRLLKRIIENGYMSKQDMIQYIEYFISYNGKKISNENAVKKWKEDITFVSKYIDDNSIKIHGRIKH